MNRIPVKSSNINSIGYDEKNKTLEIEFHSGGIYQYLNVEKELYDNIMSASSKGGFFHRFIKDKYHTKKVIN